MNNSTNKVINDLISIDNHKLKYIISHSTLVKGLRDTFPHYGIEYTEEVHEMLIEAVQTKLEGSDMEREWTEEEYKNFVIF